MELLAQLNRDGKTIVMVTHNPELARYASRVFVMDRGTIREHSAHYSCSWRETGTAPEPKDST